MSPRPRLLVLRALGLGDLLTAVPALRAIPKAFPEHHRLLAMPLWLAPLVELIAPGEFAVLHAEPLARLGPEVTGCDVAINLHGRGPESHEILIATAPRRLIAFRHPAVPATGEGPEWYPGEHEVRRWCRLLSESGIPCDEHDLSITPPPIAAPHAARGVTLVHAGAASAARHWPRDRWAQVVSSELRAGQNVVLTGTGAERGLASSIARCAGLDAKFVLAGRTGVLELAAAVAAAERVLCADTGVAHLATALGKPSVVLFGPTSPAEWGPPATGPHRVLWKGSRGDPHGDVPDPGLLQISVEEVIAAIVSLQPPLSEVAAQTPA